MKSLIILIAVIFTGATNWAASIPIDVKKVVVFIYYFQDSTNALPNGTGFLVTINSIKNTNISFGYLVTARHVVRPTPNDWISTMSVRLNRRDGDSDKILVPLIITGTNKNVFTHNDPAVDIAVIPFSPQNITNYDCLYLPVEIVTSEDDFKNLEIHEGSDVFFTGMFSHHLGEKHNTPISRFGKVALMTNEKINWLWGKTDLYLMEATSYPGNSGSPVFFQISMYRNNSLYIGGPTLKLAGVMSGFYNDTQPIRSVSVSTNQYVTPNLGISGVVPSYQLKEILFSNELQEQRAKSEN